jgi:uncharacterized membrane protein YtjA (UPF0391 family)
MVKLKLGRFVQYPNGNAAQVPFLTGTRTNHTTSGAASTAAQPIPAGAKIVEVRATDAAWIIFGTSGVGAAAADTTSILFPAGVSVLVVPFSSDETSSTHIRIMRVGANDVTVQLESLEMAGT